MGFSHRRTWVVGGLTTERLALQNDTHTYLETIAVASSAHRLSSDGIVVSCSQTPSRKLTRCRAVRLDKRYGLLAIVEKSDELQAQRGCRRRE